MEAIVLCDRGAELVAQKEVKELTNLDAGLDDCFLKFKFNTPDQLAMLCYRGQSFYRVLHVLESSSVSSVEDLKDLISKDLLERVRDKSVSVLCKRVGVHDFTSSDVISFFKKGLSCSFEKVDADIVLFVFVHHSQSFVCIDFSGFDLGKREYNIFPHSVSVKAPLAYSVLRELDYASDKVFVNVHCRSGMFVIEAALFSNKFPINFYRKNDFAFNKFFSSKYFFESVDEEIVKSFLPLTGLDSDMRSVFAARKNAKIAGVNDFVSFTKTNLDFLETKLGAESTDILFAFLPGKFPNTKELFFQAKFVLKPTGVLGLLFDQVVDLSPPDSFSLFKRHVFERGNNYTLVVFKKVKVT